MVFVLDTNKQPLAPCCEAKARKLLKQNKAAVWRRFPFSIILKRAVEPADVSRDLRVKIDPGSRHTGLALLRGESVLWLGQIDHRTNIKDKLDARRAFRRRRRSKNLRYRQPRFDNRVKPAGWLPPSIRSKADNIVGWVERLRKLAPIGAISYENVKFDMQLMQNPEISGVGYQQGELAGYEVREYLLEKFNHKCAYCGASDVSLEIEHIVPKSRGGSNRVSNLAIACHGCNQRKGTKTAAEFGHAEVQAQAKKPLKDAAMVQAMRWSVWRRLADSGLPVECGSGGRTKMNRLKLGLPKDHSVDAACVGSSTPEKLRFASQKVQIIKAAGRGRRQRTTLDKYGFPRAYLARKKSFFGFMSGDIVKAVQPAGKHKGVYVGRVSCRTSGSFDVGAGKSIRWKNMTLLQRNDGYGYENRFVGQMNERRQKEN